MKAQVPEGLDKFLKEYRYERNMTQSQLADHVHVSVAVISSIECGRRPGGHSLYRLRKTFPSIDEATKRLEEKQRIKPDNPDFPEKVNRNSPDDHEASSHPISSQENNGS
jgi:transcriptional regulator with XRE-family HTH domain